MEILFLLASSRRSAGWPPVVSAKRLWLFCLSLAMCAAGVFPSGNAAAGDAEHPPDKKSPLAKVSLGPRDTDFNSHGYKICNVVRVQRSLNALGIAALLGKAKKVGKYVELPKRLEASERGEYFLVTWKYSGKNPPRRAVLTFEYKLSNEERLESLTREYSDLKRGRRRVRIDNIGERYRQKGRIEYWRVRLFAKGELVARKESFLWPAFKGEEEVHKRGGV